MAGRTFVLSFGGCVLLALAALVGLPLLALRPSPLKPETPAILRGARAGGGWNTTGCPRLESMMRFYPGKEALSPDLTPRLAAAFPPGSDADVLRAVLLAQGFSSEEPCEDDPTIHQTLFKQVGGGFAGPFPIHAVVAWKQTAGGQIVWTKGFVSYTGP